jgi:hypothetical protein
MLVEAFSTAGADPKHGSAGQGASAERRADDQTVEGVELSPPDRSAREHRVLGQLDRTSAGVERPRASNVGEGVFHVAALAREQREPCVDVPVVRIPIERPEECAPLAGRFPASAGQDAGDQVGALAEDVQLSRPLEPRPHPLRLLGPRPYRALDLDRGQRGERKGRGCERSGGADEGRYG